MAFAKPAENLQKTLAGLGPAVLVAISPRAASRRRPKHGVSWKGDYIDEGVFAGPPSYGTSVVHNTVGPGLCAFSSSLSGADNPKPLDEPSELF